MKERTRLKLIELATSIAQDVGHAPTTACAMLRLLDSPLEMNNLDDELEQFTGMTTYRTGILAMALLSELQDKDLREKIEEAAQIDCLTGRLNNDEDPGPYVDTARELIAALGPYSTGISMYREVLVIGQGTEIILTRALLGIEETSRANLEEIAEQLKGHFNALVEAFSPNTEIRRIILEAQEQKSHLDRGYNDKAINLWKQEGQAEADEEAWNLAENEEVGKLEIYSYKYDVSNDEILRKLLTERKRHQVLALFLDGRDPKEVVFCPPEMCRPAQNDPASFTDPAITQEKPQ